MTPKEVVKLLESKLTFSELLAIDDVFDREGSWAVEEALADRVAEMIETVNQGESI